MQDMTATPMKIKTLADWKQDLIELKSCGTPWVRDRAQQAIAIIERHRVGTVDRFVPAQQILGVIEPAQLEQLIENDNQRADAELLRDACTWAAATM